MSLYVPPLVIGLSGLAGSGKDLFCKLLIKKLAKLGHTAKRYALADELKARTREFILDNYHIDILNCTREEKDLIRPFLVAHGGILRVKSKGTHWTKRVSQIFNQEKPSIAIVTDVRYDQYPEDELYWLKNVLSGVFVHISLYWYETDTIDYPRTHLKKVFVQPPNEHEALNDPLLKSKADYRVEWEKLKNLSEEEIDNQLTPHIEKFLDYLVGTNRLSWKTSSP